MEQSYIYAIKGNGMTYYGSSFQSLFERKSTHQSTYKYFKKIEKLDKCCTSYLILDSCDDWIIEKIEDLPIESTREQILLRENYYIENFECVNKNLAIRTAEMNREYQRLWAEKDRREKGIEPSGSKESNTKEYKAEWMANYRASMTEEEKKKQLEHRREEYAKKGLTEEQREASKERAKKQREAIKADPEKAEQIKEYKKLKAREYREKKKQSLL
jgi:hypothetical protein